MKSFRDFWYEDQLLDHVVDGVHRSIVVAVAPQVIGRSLVAVEGAGDLDRNGIADHDGLGLAVELTDDKSVVGLVVFGCGDLAGNLVAGNIGVSGITDVADQTA